MKVLSDDRCPAHLRRGHDRFCPIALTDWLAATERAGIPHVPGTAVAEFERADLQHHEYQGPHQDRLDAAFFSAAAECRIYREQHASGETMMRWDCCASGNLKMALSDGQPDVPAAVRNALPIDMRLLEILDEYPRVTLAAVVRPWVTDILLWNRWPVEYRAFVENGRLIGISSYYPQRPLRRDDDELRSVARMTEALIGAVEGPFDWPIRQNEFFMEQKYPAPDIADPDGAHFTADFLATERGMLFLEGGPPWFMGAHPCCFEGRGKIRGVSLSTDDDPKELP